MMNRGFAPVLKCNMPVIQKSGSDGFIVHHSTFNISSGGHREGEIPDPIPNSEVKTLVADGTSLKRLGE